MGSTTSNINNISLLYNKLTDIIKDQYVKYDGWTKEDNSFCDKIALIHYNTLIRYEKSDLLNASIAVGIKYDGDIDKKKICESLIEHFKKRLLFLKDIRNAIENNYTKLRQALNGPVCKNITGYVNNDLECARYGGTWINIDEYKINLNKIKKSVYYFKWKSYLDKFENKYMKYLNKFFNIVNLIINDTDNSMSDDDFNKLKESSNELIEKMNNVCDILYLILVNYK